MRTLPLLFAAWMTLWQMSSTALAPAGGSASTATSPAKPAPIATTAAPAGLEDYLHEKMARRRIPGMQVAVVRDGRIVFSGSYGKANLQDDIAVTPDTVFSINSATKTFTGVAILQLAQAGKLSLDAPVSRYLDGLPPAWQPITVRQLLNHTSGLPDILVPPRAQGTGGLVGEGGEDAAWDAVRKLPMDFPTGTAYRYNQTNYVLLGRIIDSLGGMPFTRFIAERQFVPAGMIHAGFGDSRDVTPHRAQPYRYAGGATGSSPGALEHAFDEFPRMLRTGAGINTTATDVANWLIALQGGRLLDAGSLRELWAPGRFNDGRATSWASGWPRIDREDHPAVAGIGGRRSAFFVYPQDHLAVVVLTNLAGANPEEFIDEIAGFYVPDLSVQNGGGLPRRVKALRSGLIARGWEQGMAVVADLKRKDPGYALREDDLNAWGYRLVQDGQVKEGLAVLKLNTDLYPRSGNTFDTLAGAYAISGDREAAIRNYRLSLERDPGNRNAVDQLRALGAPVASGAPPRQ
nr:serine hydrolase domain-containing protein [Pseudoxanthomonas sp.]